MDEIDDDDDDDDDDDGAEGATTSNWTAAAAAPPPPLERKEGAVVVVNVVNVVAAVAGSGENGRRRAAADGNAATATTTRREAFSLISRWMDFASLLLLCSRAMIFYRRMNGGSERDMRAFFLHYFLYLRIADLKFRSTFFSTPALCGSQHTSSKDSKSSRN